MFHPAILVEPRHRDSRERFGYSKTDLTAAVYTPPSTDDRMSPRPQLPRTGECQPSFLYARKFPSDTRSPTFPFSRWGLRLLQIAEVPSISLHSPIHYYSLSFLILVSHGLVFQWLASERTDLRAANRANEVKGSHFRTRTLSRDLYEPKWWMMFDWSTPLAINRGYSEPNNMKAKKGKKLDGVVLNGKRLLAGSSLLSEPLEIPSAGREIRSPMNRSVTAK